MALFVRHKLTVTARRSVLAVAVLCAPAPSFAAKASVEQKQAEGRVTQAQLDATREELAVRVADYVEISQQLERRQGAGRARVRRRDPPPPTRGWPRPSRP